jgi:hypothetical protein
VRVSVIVIIFFVALAFAYSVLLQPPGCNQTAHYSLVESLVHGSPRIDAYHDQTCDTAYLGGHYYAAKAPGLAIAVAPWYAILHAVGAVATNPSTESGFPQAMLALPRRALWAVGLFGAVLPALLLVLLVKLVAGRIAPRCGLPVAAAVGLGTMVLPFATVLFAHELASCLGFAAFALLFVWNRPVWAGVAAGLAVTVDFPLAIIAAALAVYAWRRAGPFAAGTVVGVLPLLTFNTWAFRNPFHLSYANAVLNPGKTGHDVLGANASGFFGIGVPSARVGAELLLSPRGLVILSPVLLAALAGLWRLRTREAALGAAVFVIFVVYNAGYYTPFGGYVPGPRFLIATVPFLSIGLAVAFRDWPLATTVLGAFSIGAMTVATAAEPLLGNDDTHSWIVRWQHGDFAYDVLVHGHGWGAALPFLLAVAVAAGCAATQLPRLVLTRSAVVAIVGVTVLFLAAPDLLHTDRAVSQSTGLIALAVLTLALTAAIVGGVWIAGIPLLALTLPGFAAHTKQSLLVAACSLALGAALLAGTRRRRALTARR